MSKTTELILIHHGEKEWNLFGRWQGHSDSQLNECGVVQAEALGKRIYPDNFDCLYSSILDRAMHTSRLVSASSWWCCKGVFSLYDEFPTGR
jgi:broad specificity phosphatase PhoE